MKMSRCAAAPAGARVKRAGFIVDYTVQHSRVVIEQATNNVFQVYGTSTKL